MSIRRLYSKQPDSFAFTVDNLKWANAQMTKYPEGRQASAVIPILWRAQEQEGWVTRPAIETVANMLGMDYIRVLEVASFYFMFQLQPVGSVAHIQVCGTLSCMLCGAEDLIGVCKRRIGSEQHALSKDGKFSWEEVECLGACSNAPMAQIGKDYYEDLTVDKFESLLDILAEGKVPIPGPQNGRFAAEPLSGLTSLKDGVDSSHSLNGSAERAMAIGDTVKRIQGNEVPFRMPTGDAKKVSSTSVKPKVKAKIKKVVKKPNKTSKKTIVVKTKAPAQLKAARQGKADDLQVIKGVGPKLEKLLHKLGFFHYDQIANWNAGDIAWVDENLEGFKGRVERDTWVAQAKKLIK